jgi:hypothetical protein
LELSKEFKVKYKDLISEHGSPADFMVIDSSRKQQSSIQQIFIKLNSITEV